MIPDYKSNLEASQKLNSELREQLAREQAAASKLRMLIGDGRIAPVVDRAIRICDLWNSAQQDFEIAFLAAYLDEFRTLRLERDEAKSNLAAKAAECVCSCGQPMVRNPHPDAGKLDTLLEVGTDVVCVPCLCKSRHDWSQRALKAEVENARMREALKQILNTHGDPRINDDYTQAVMVVGAMASIAAAALASKEAL